MSNVITVTFQELLKAEWCVMRHGQVCKKTDNGVYYADLRSSHNVQRGLTIYEVYYALNEAAKRLGLNNVNELIENALRELKYEGEASLESLIDALIKRGYLVRLPPDDETAEVYKFVKESISNSSIINLTDESSFISLARMKSIIPVIDTYKPSENLEKYMYKTIYGDFMRLLKFTAASFDKIYSLEAYLLPFVIDQVESEGTEPFANLCGDIERYLGNKDVAYKVCEVLKKHFPKLRTFQFNNISEMLKYDDPKIQVISAPTGSGKTAIFLIYGLLRVLKEKLKGEKGKIMFVYPRKSLAREQLQRVVEVLYDLNKQLPENLRVSVMIFDGDSPKIKKVESNSNTTSSSTQSITFRGLSLHDEPLVIRNEKVYKGEEELRWLSDRGYNFENRDYDLVITNIYQLSTALNMLHNKKYMRFLENIKCIILDEAHVYLNQGLGDFSRFTLARFFTLVKAETTDTPSISNDITEKMVKDLDIILSSATLIDRYIPDDISLSTIGGLRSENFAPSTRDNQDTVRQFVTYLLGERLLNTYDKAGKFIYVRYSARGGNERLTLPYITFVHPSKGSETLFIEQLLTSLVFSSVGSLKDFHPKILAFVDNKDTMREIVNKMHKRGIKQEKAPLRKLLLVSGLDNLTQDSVATQILSLLNSNNKIYDSKNPLLTFSHAHWVNNGVVELTGQEFLDQINKDSELMKALEVGKYIVNSERRDYEIISRDSHGKEKTIVIRHNADIEKDRRISLEEKLSRGDFLLAVSTSTLELGVNIPDVGVIIQYGLPTSADSFIQRVGRAGRSPNTHYVSLAIISARQLGPDLKLLDEEQSFRDLFTLRFNTQNLKPDEFTLKRYSFLLLLDVIKRYAYLNSPYEWLNNIERNKKELGRYLNIYLMLLGIKDLDTEKVINEFVKILKPLDDLVIKEILESNKSLSEIYDELFKKLQFVNDIKEEFMKLYKDLDLGYENMRSNYEKIEKDNSVIKLGREALDELSKLLSETGGIMTVLKSKIDNLDQDSIYRIDILNELNSRLISLKEKINSLLKSNHIVSSRYSTRDIVLLKRNAESVQEHVDKMMELINSLVSSIMVKPFMYKLLREKTFIFQGSRVSENLLNSIITSYLEATYYRVPNPSIIREQGLKISVKDKNNIKERQVEISELLNKSIPLKTVEGV